MTPLEKSRLEEMTKAALTGVLAATPYNANPSAETIAAYTVAVARATLAAIDRDQVLGTSQTSTVS